MGSSYAAKRPNGLHKLILADAPATIHTWLQGINKLRAELPKSVREVLDRCEHDNKMESKKYEEAVNVFYERHLCPKRPWPPEEVGMALENMTRDPTVYGTMSVPIPTDLREYANVHRRYGVSELVITGSLKNRSVVKQASRIQASTLLINGTHDEAQDVYV